MSPSALKIEVEPHHESSRTRSVDHLSTFRHSSRLEVVPVRLADYQSDAFVSPVEQIIQTVAAHSHVSSGPCLTRNLGFARPIIRSLLGQDLSAGASMPVPVSSNHRSSEQMLATFGFAPTKIDAIAKDIFARIDRFDRKKGANGLWSP